MAVEKLKVEIDVQGEAPAAAAAARLEAKARKAEERARVAKFAAEDADQASRRAGRGVESSVRGLLDSARKRGILKEDSLEFGAVKIGRQGFGVSEEWMKGKRGAVAGPLLAVYAVRSVSQAVTSVGDRIADWRDEGLSPAQMLREAAKGTAEFATAPSVGLARMLSRWTAGYTAEEAELAADDLVSNAFGKGPSQLDQAIDAQRATRREFLKNLWAQQEKEARAKLKRQESIEEVHRKLDEDLARRLEGLRAPQLPTRVPDALFKDMQWVRRHMEEMRTQILKKRAEAGAGA